jgi:hypothetical protein
LGTAISAVSAERHIILPLDLTALGEAGRDRPRRVNLDPVALAIIDRQREHGKPLLPRQGGADHRIEPARQQHHRSLHSAIPSLGAIQKKPA